MKKISMIVATLVMISGMSSFKKYCTRICTPKCISIFGTMVLGGWTSTTLEDTKKNTKSAYESRSIDRVTSAIV